MVSLCGLMVLGGLKVWYLPPERGILFWDGLALELRKNRCYVVSVLGTSVSDVSFTVIASS